MQPFEILLYCRKDFVANFCEAAEPSARDFRRLVSCSRITIGGVGFLGPVAIMEGIENDPALVELFARLKPPFLSSLHGDLHFRNILLDDRLPRMMEVMLLDPRGSVLAGCLPGIGDPVYDLGKLLFSSRGRSHLIQEQLFRPRRGSLKLSKDGEADVEPFDKVVNEQVRVSGGLSEAQLDGYRASVEDWIWDVFDELGRYVKECVEETSYPAEDPDWWLRACLYEALHFCSLAPMCVEEDPEVAINLFLRGTELLNRFLDDFREVKFPAMVGFRGAQHDH